MAEAEANIIVAIPKEDDYVWKVSSEKVPHMTILYLDNLGNNFERILEFIAHACEDLPRFSLSVDHRGTLGPDEADVVFFRTNDYELKSIKQFRSNLLQNPDISQAFNAIPQFPEWTPHLTLGYPQTPAKPDPRDYPGVTYVQFDRIAIWTQNYSGPEIELKSDPRWEISMSDIPLDALKHHGVKGQKWGVRRAQKQLAKADARWNKEITTVNTKSRMTMAFHNETVSRINRAVDDLNRSDKYRNVDLNTFHGKVRSDYEKDSHEAIMRALEDSVRSHYGQNPSGTMRATYNRKTDQIEIHPIPKSSVQHADTTSSDIPDMVIQLHRNSVGLITSVSLIPALPIQHVDDLITNILEHHGVKGQKWGVRRDRSGGGSPGRTSNASHPASEDATKANANRQKARSSGTDSLSNQELQHLVTRMNLEKQYKNLNSERATINKGNSKVKQILGVGRTIAEVYNFVNSPAGQAVKTVLKAKK